MHNNLHLIHKSCVQTIGSSVCEDELSHHTLAQGSTHCRNYYDNILSIGQETSANLLSFTIVFLLQNPDVLERYVGCDVHLLCSGRSLEIY